MLVYFYGGGFVAGDGSEPRYDGESMARKGIVSLTVNYRLGVFGFLAHPELTKESPRHASGNYALLDQHAALQWVQKNIAAFGGDPAKVTIAGESAGSIAVSALMASPLSKDLIAGAIGESGALDRADAAARAARTGGRGRDEVRGQRRCGIACGATRDVHGPDAGGRREAAHRTVRIRRSTATFSRNSPWRYSRRASRRACRCSLDGTTEESSGRAILAANDPTPENLAKALQNTLRGSRQRCR